MKTQKKFVYVEWKTISDFKEKKSKEIIFKIVYSPVQKFGAVRDALNVHQKIAVTVMDEILYFIF